MFGRKKKNIEEPTSPIEVFTSDEIVSKIEEDKQNRSKCYYSFSLSLDDKEELAFRKGLRQLMNEVSQT